MLPIKIAGLGFYLPERRVLSSELERLYGTTPGWIERTTGVRERRYVADETAAGMAAAAARMALLHAGLKLSDVDAIIGASASPQQAIPCTAALVQRELGAPEGVSACFDVNATCLSFLFALHNAAHLVAAGAYRHVLIVSSDITTNSLNPREPESAVLFGDAAAAALVTRSEPGETSALLHARFATHSSGADYTTIVGGGTLHHPNDPHTTPEMNLFHMDGSAIFRQATRVAGPFLTRFFSEVGWRRDEVDLVIPHQASFHALRQLSTRFGFQPKQVFLNLHLRGNCIGASIPLAFAEATHTGEIHRGQKLVLLGTGAGLTLGAMALIY